MTDRVLPAVVVGAGPAGLATSRELHRRGIEHVVLERGDGPGHTWAHQYDSLVLHTTKRLSSLPGLPFPSSTPTFPSRLQLLDYLEHYAASFRLPVQADTTVSEVTSANGPGWIVQTSRGELRARTLVVATGIASNPHVPRFEGLDSFGGTVLHSHAYRRPDVFAGRRVLVVGAGNSAGEIAAELAASGVPVTIAVRSGANVIPREILGIPCQYLGLAIGSLPRWLWSPALKTVDRAVSLVRGPSLVPPATGGGCTTVPLIGSHLPDAIRSGRLKLKGGIGRFASDEVNFADGSRAGFDVVLLATGYRPATGFLGGLVTMDECSLPCRRRTVASAEHGALYFVGFTPGVRGTLYNIRHEARLAAAEIAQLV